MRKDTATKDPRSASMATKNISHTAKNLELSEGQLEVHFRRLQLAHMRRIYKEVTALAEKESWAYRDFLALLLAEEVAHRKQTRLQRCTRNAHFPFFKTVDEFDFTLQSTLRQSLLGSYLGPDPKSRCDLSERTGECDTPWECLRELGRKSAFSADSLCYLDTCRLRGGEGGIRRIECRDLHGPAWAGSEPRNKGLSGVSIFARSYRENAKANSHEKCSTPKPICSTLKQESSTRQRCDYIPIEAGRLRGVTHNIAPGLIRHIFPHQQRRGPSRESSAGTTAGSEFLARVPSDSPDRCIF